MNDVILDAADVFELTVCLVGVPSVSGTEQALADLVEARLRSRAVSLDTRRIGNNVVARTQHGAAQRLAFAGHLDTVTPVGPIGATVAGNQVEGLGAVDMKGGLAVMLLLAEEVADSAFDCTFIFYEKEELGSHQSGLHHLFADHPDLVTADFAVVLEPTDGVLEVGCQGNLNVKIEFHGRTAHSARPWRGRNAIHRAAPALARLSEFTPETAEVGGLIFPQAFSLVAVTGGRQGNMVPDHCSAVVNYRHAPSVSTAEAIDTVRRLVPEADELTVTLKSPSAPPRVDHPLIARLRELGGMSVRPKLGWTDVARFAEHGIPAINYGPGDPEQAHTPREVVSREDLERCHAALAGLLGSAAPRRLRPAQITGPVDSPLVRRCLSEFTRRAPSIEELIKPAQESEHLRVAYGDRYLARPALLESDTARGLEVDLSRLFALMAEVPERMFGGDLAEVGRAVGMTQVQIDSVRRTAADGPVKLGRADLYQEAGGFRLLEFNIGSPLGGFDNAELNRAMLRHPFLADFVAAEGLLYIDTLARIADVIKQECEHVPADSVPVVAMVDTPPHFAEMERRLHFVARIWAGMGLDTVPCSLDQLEERSGKLFAEGKAVDVVYRFFLIEDLLDSDSLPFIEPVLRACERGQVALLARMDAELYGNKGILALLSDCADRGELSADEAALVTRFLPWSRPLCTGPPPRRDEGAGQDAGRGEHADLLRYAQLNQHDLVLKPTLMHGGIGITPGWTVSAEEWKERLGAAADGPYVLQRRVRPVTESFPVAGEPGACQPLALNWGVFLIQDCYGGTIVRGSSDPDVGIVSLATGAQVGCCFHEPVPTAATG